MASDIQVTSLTADGGLGKITLVAIAIPPTGKECLAYMQPTKIEFWASNTNNRASAVKVGESTGFFEHTGLPDTVARYYWARAVDLDGNFGAYYPVSATAGVVAVTKTTVPADGSITGPKLADGAVTDVKIASMSASKLTAGVVTVTISFTSPIINGGTITGGLFRTAASGRRIEMDGSVNYIKIYDSAGNIVGTLGEIGSLNALFGVNRDIAYDNVIITNNNVGGTAIRTTGRIVLSAPVTGSFDINLLDVSNSKTSNNAHAARFRNTGTGGGEAVLGVSAGGGGYALNAQTGGVYSAGGYLPFTGMHECLARRDAGLEPGDIVYVKRVLHRDGLDNVLTEVARTDAVGDRRVIGIVSEIKDIPRGSPLAALGCDQSAEVAKRRRRYLYKTFQHVTVNALGEGQMDVCGRGGDIGAGDYIVTSDLPGKGQRQNDAGGDADDLLRRCTVAQAMEPVTFDSLDQVRRVAVFYRCG